MCGPRARLAPAHSDAGVVSVFHSAQSLSWTRGMVHGWMSTSKNAESLTKGIPAHTSGRGERRRSQRSRRALLPKGLPHSMWPMHFLRPL